MPATRPSRARHKDRFRRSIRLLLGSRTLRLSELAFQDVPQPCGVLTATASWPATRARPPSSPVDRTPLTGARFQERPLTGSGRSRMRASLDETTLVSDGSSR